MRLPDVYIIGAQKSGTTTLYDWISQHPQIYGDPLAKDFPFFSQDSLYKKGPKELAKFSKGAKPDQLILGGEVNAMFVKYGAKRLYETIPKAKLIAILRNPIDRAYSAYCYAVERLLENRSFEKAINDELAGCNYSWFDSMQKDYLKHGLYAQQLKSILKYFSKEQIFVIIFEEWKKEPIKIMRNLFKFLEIDENFIPVMKVKNVTKGGCRSKLISKLIYWQAPENIFGKFLKFIIPFKVRTSIRQKLAEFNRIESTKPLFPDTIRKLLREYYKNEIKELEEILGRKLTMWY